jgi:LysR family transcriptional activator of dmlA
VDKRIDNEDLRIVLRSRWDAQPYLDSGALVQVLPQYRQDANVGAAYPQRLAGSAKVRVCVEFMEQHLALKT